MKDGHSRKQHKGTEGVMREKLNDKNVKNIRQYILKPNFLLIYCILRPFQAF